MMYTVYGFVSYGVASAAHGGYEESEIRPVFFFTPCLSFDQAYWSARGVGQFCLFSSPLPVGRAIAKVKRLNGEWQAFIGLNKNVGAGTGDPAFFIACFEEFARRYGISGQAETEAEAEANCNVRFSVSGDDLPQLDEMEQEATFIFPLLAGRALWVEEVASAVSSQLTDGQRDHHGGGESVTRKLILLLQYLFLSGNLEITSGVEILAESGANEIDRVREGVGVRARARARAGKRRYGLINRILSHFTGKKDRFHCHRCGAEEREEIHVTFCASCNHTCAYCTRCITMGRSRMCNPLFLFQSTERKEADGKGGELQSNPLQIKLQLTPRQEFASIKAIELLLQPASDSASSPAPVSESVADELLIWAVCGAGKTEVIYPVINEALLRGRQVLITTPRKDVVLELGPRVAQAFPLHRTVVLHGSSRNKWENGDITIATTHQLLRFYHRFDLVILDEVDAFPYHNNPMLYRAVHRAAARQKEQNGKIIYLSATPPAILVRRLGRESERVVKIPARYHGHPLPVPKQILLSSINLNERLTSDRARSGGPIIALDPFFKRVIGESRQAFVFVPYIEQVELVRAYICKHYVEIAPFTVGVHSRDPEREQKVMRFRQGSIRLLVTTTVLERGVTVPGTDVMVWSSDSELFDEASLVQIAGRAGRSADDPDGWVWFVAARRTQSQVAAIRHIREMNRLANRLGLLGGSVRARLGRGDKTG